MATSAELTLEQILNKLNIVVERLGDKTVAREREEQKLQQYNERRQQATPDASVKDMTSVAADVAAIAKEVLKGNVGTLQPGEQKRIENIAKIYGKTLKIADNFASIKQLLKNAAPDKQPKQGLFSFSLPTFNLKSINSKLQLQYVQLSSAVGRLFDVRWVGKLKDTISANATKSFDKLSLPEFKLPQLKWPTFKLPEFKLPEFKLPVFKWPTFKLPTFKLPEFKLPQLKWSTFKLPEFKLPVFKWPTFKLPEFKLPEFKLPEFKLPQLKWSTFKLPEFKLPVFKWPTLKLPEFKLPEFKLPKFNTIEQSIQTRVKKYSDKLSELKTNTGKYIANIASNINTAVEDTTTYIRKSNVFKQFGELKQSISSLRTATSAYIQRKSDEISSSYREISKQAAVKYKSIKSTLPEFSTIKLLLESRIKKYGDKLSNFRTDTEEYVTKISNNISSAVDITKKYIKQSTTAKLLKDFKTSVGGLRTATSAYIQRKSGEIAAITSEINKQAVEKYTSIKVALKEKFIKLQDKITDVLPIFKKKPAQPDKAEVEQSWASKFKKSSLGITAMGVGIALLVGAMIKCKLVDAKSVGVFAGVVAVVGMAMWGLAKKSDDISKGAKAIGILSIAFGAIVFALNKLTTVKWDSVKGGLLAAGLAIGGLTGIAMIIGKFVTKNPAAAVAGGVALMGLALTMGMIGNNLKKFDNLDWKKISANIVVAGIAITGLATLAGVIGGLMVGSGGLGALIAGAGLAALTALAWTMGYTGEQLKVYNDIEGDHLSSIGDGLKNLGSGLANFFESTGITGGVGRATIQNIGKWFGLDIVSQLKKYEVVDSVKVDLLGKSLSTLSIGLKDIASVDDKQVRASLGGIKELELLNTEKIYGTLDGIAARLSNINKISSALSESGTKIKLEVQGISEMNAAIDRMNQQETDLLTRQLSVLAESRDLLQRITQNTTQMGGGGSNASGSAGHVLLVKERSTTRQSFFNNIRMASTTLKD